MSDSDAANKRTLRLALALTSGAMLVEAAGGIISNSLALVADAVHMLVDAVAMAFSLWALRLAGRRGTDPVKPNGRRSLILTASFAGFVLWASAGTNILEAFRRLKLPPEIRSGLMMAVAVFGLLVNMGVAAMLYHRRTRSLGIRGSFVHTMADGLASLAVIAAVVVIRATGSFAWDPAAAIAISLLVLWSSARLVLETLRYPREKTAS